MTERDYRIMTNKGRTEIMDESRATNCPTCGEPVHLEEIEKGNGEIVERQSQCPYTQVEEIIVHGRRWRDQFNTYHSVMVEADGEVVGVEPFAYGYGDQYQQTGLEILIENGTLPKLTYENGVDYGLRRTCEVLEIELTTEVYDVRRKRELHRVEEESQQ